MLSSMKMQWRQATAEERCSTSGHPRLEIRTPRAWRALEDGLLLGAVLGFLPCRIHVGAEPAREIPVQRAHVTEPSTHGGDLGLQQPERHGAGVGEPAPGPLLRRLATIVVASLWHRYSRT